GPVVSARGGRRPFRSGGPATGATQNPVVAEARSHRIPRRPRPRLLDGPEVRAGQLPVVLRHRAVRALLRAVAGEPLSGKHSGAVRRTAGDGVVARLYPRADPRQDPTRHDRLHARPEKGPLSPRAVAVPRLDAAAAGLAGVAPRL